MKRDSFIGFSKSLLRRVLHSTCRLHRKQCTIDTPQDMIFDFLSHSTTTTFVLRLVYKMKRRNVRFHTNCTYPLKIFIFFSFFLQLNDTGDLWTPSIHFDYYNRSFVMRNELRTMKIIHSLLTYRTAWPFKFHVTIKPHNHAFSYKNVCRKVSKLLLNFPFRSKFVLTLIIRLAFAFENCNFHSS